MIHMFNSRINVIKQTHFTECIDMFRIACNEKRVGAITVTINQKDVPENGTFGVRQEFYPLIYSTVENIKVFLTILSDWKAFWSAEVLNNSKLLNTASSKELLWVYFSHVPRAVIAYYRAFD